MTPALRPAERRVLVLAPRGRDGEVVSQLLTAHGFEAAACADVSALLQQMREGAALATVTEEALVGPALSELFDWLAEQPPWSDFPMIVLASRHTGQRSEAAMATLRDLINVVLLERPLNAQTLLSAIRSAWRSRLRQYESRRQLEEQRRISRENARLLQSERAASAEARAAREALSLAVDAADLGTFHCPMPLGRVVWNDTCRRHFGLAPDAPVDLDAFYARLHPDDVERTRRAIADTIDHRRPYDIEFRSLTDTNQPRWLRAKGRAYEDGSGQVIRFDGVTIDISQQKELEAQRERLLAAERDARAEAERASRSKDQFLATLSHELRTPLSAMLGWITILRRRPGDAADVERGLDTIERNARAQAHLIEELLDMSRIITGNVTLDRQPVQPAAVLDAVLATLQPALEAKGLRLQCEVDPALGSLNADPHRLQQIVWNLVANAVKFTPEGGTLALELADRGEAVELTVRDTGIGIAADFLPFVFDRFRQADESSTRHHGGLGLGLAIVRQLVELHGGTVQVSSDGPGRGARFVVRLPKQPAGEDADDAGADGQRVRAADALLGATPSPDDPTPLAGLRVLLVDDDTDGREVTARLLGEAGARVQQADGAAAALSHLAGAPPHAYDLLLSDVAMPGMDGHALIARLRADGHDLPAIALTAFARPEDRQAALHSGFALHLSKPVETAHLVQAVRQAMQPPAAPGPHGGEPASSSLPLSTNLAAEHGAA